MPVQTRKIRKMYSEHALTLCSMSCRTSSCMEGKEKRKAKRYLIKKYHLAE